jgi:MFS family permease
LFVHGSFYVVDYSLVATAPDIYGHVYHLNELQIGLTYLPRGIGIITGSYFNGRLMDHNYKYVAKQVEWTSRTLSGDDLRMFPFERARTRGSIWLLCISTAGLIAYGWAVWGHVYIAVPLILQYLLGFMQTCFYTIYSTLLVDTFPERPSTAAAAASVVRCAMAASALAILQPLLDAAGRGWYFTFLGVWSGGFCAPAIWLIRRYGMQWRLARSPDPTQAAR